MPTPLSPFYTKPEDPTLERHMAEFVQIQLYPTEKSFKQISIPRVPSNVLQMIIQEAWNVPQNKTDRIKLMKTSILISRVYLHFYLYVSAYDIHIPNEAYARHILEFCQGRTPLSTLFPASAEMVRLFCHSMTLYREYDGRTYCDRYEGHGIVMALLFRPRPQQSHTQVVPLDENQYSTYSSLLISIISNRYRMREPIFVETCYDDDTCPFQNGFNRTVASSSYQGLVWMNELKGMFLLGLAPEQVATELHLQLFKQNTNPYSRKPTWSETVGTLYRSMQLSVSHNCSNSSTSDTPSKSYYLPTELHENIIQQAWLSRQSISDRVKLMTTFNLVNLTWLVIFTRISSYDIIIPTPRYLLHLLDYHDHMTPIARHFPELIPLPSKLCRSMRICKVNSPLDGDPSEEEKSYIDMPDPCITQLRYMSLLITPVPSWVPLSEQSRWSQEEAKRVEQIIARHTVRLFLDNGRGWHADIFPREHAGDVWLAESILESRCEQKGLLGCPEEGRYFVNKDPAPSRFSLPKMGDVIFRRHKG